VDEGAAGSGTDAADAVVFLAAGVGGSSLIRTLSKVKKIFNRKNKFAPFFVSVLSELRDLSVDNFRLRLGGG
jgi:hypothetical protein